MKREHVIDHSFVFFNTLRNEMNGMCASHGRDVKFAQARRLLERLGIDGCESVEWVQLAEGAGASVVVTLMNYRFLLRAGNILSS